MKKDFVLLVRSYIFEQRISAISQLGFVGMSSVSMPRRLIVALFLAELFPNAIRVELKGLLILPSLAEPMESSSTSSQSALSGGSNSRKK